jgi:hypothetical protein
VRTLGGSPFALRRPFVARGEVFEMRLTSRGYTFELDPPLAVEVLEGRIKGTATKPPAGYVRKPGVAYASTRLPSLSDAPENRAGGDSP